MTYYGSRSSVSQYLNFLYKSSTHQCFFLAKYESMLEEPKVEYFTYELVVDYEQKIFDELSPQERREKSLDKILN